MHNFGFVLKKMNLELFVGTFFIYVVAGSSLNGPCEKDEQCGTLDSYCRNGICVCSENFLKHEDSCIQVLLPQLACLKNTDCYPVKGSRSMCKDGTCACIPFHHEHNNLCVKNRGLHERCEHDHQCYWGKAMEAKMGCIEGVCSCKPGYTPHNNRKCVSGATYNLVVSNVTIAALLVVLKLFK